MREDKKSGLKNMRERMKSHSENMQTAQMIREKESEIERYFVTEIKRHGGLCIKVIPDYARGFPDRCVILPRGGVIWVELKRSTGAVAAAQKIQHEKLRRLGQRVEVLWSRVEVDRLLQEIKEKQANTV